MAAKTACPVTRSQFASKAQSVQVTIGGQTFTANPKTFSTGSMGWYASTKVSIVVDGRPIQVQVGLNLTIVGSKDVPMDASAPQASTPQANPSATVA